MSKGSRQRPVNRQQFDANWERIFSKDTVEVTEYGCCDLHEMTFPKGDRCPRCEIEAPTKAVDNAEPRDDTKATE